MSDSVDRLLSYLLVVAAVSVAVTLVHREFFGSSRAPDEPRPPEFVKEWRNVAAIGRKVGPEGAAVTIVEFADLECPYCRRFNKTMKTLSEKFPTQVALSFVHMPLPQHRFAQPAARAAECAFAVNRFGPFVDGIYEHQDSLGIKTWTRFAQDAGILDTSRFNRCMSDTTALPAVDKGLSIARQLKVAGTPTVMLNGWLYTGVPRDSELVVAINAVLAGREPHKRKYAW